MNAETARAPAAINLFLATMPRSVAIVPLALLAAALGALAPARAMVGGAGAAPGAIARTIVMIVGSRGNFCTGTVLTREIILTAAHCVLPGADYKLLEFDAKHQPLLRDLAEVARHPKFDLPTLLGHRATADVALLKLAAPLPAHFAPALLAAAVRAIKPEDAFVVAGFGLAARGDGKTGGTARAATLVATGQPGSLQLRLVDPATRNLKPGLGACTGDSGAPVFEPLAGLPRLVGLVSWSTAANNAAGCGGLTGATPLTLYAGWIVDTARRMGAPLAR